MNYQDACLMSEKVTADLRHLLQAYGKDLGDLDDEQHDFAVMLRHDDLQIVWLKFIEENEVIRAEYTYHFAEGRWPRLYDTAEGLTLVPIPTTATPKIIIRQKDGDGEAAYRHLLRINWSPAAKYQRPAGRTVNDGHTARKTGGRARTEIFLDAASRVTGQIASFHPRRFGFIRVDDQHNLIFFHFSDMEFPTHSLRLGLRVVFNRVFTPKGPQAKGVTLAG